MRVCVILGDYNWIFCRHWVLLRRFKGELQVNPRALVSSSTIDAMGLIFDHISFQYSTYRGTRTMAAIVFVIGFWMLDLANNTVQVILSFFLSL